MMSHDRPDTYGAEEEKDILSQRITLLSEQNGELLGLVQQKDGMIKLLVDRISEAEKIVRAYLSLPIGITTLNPKRIAEFESVCERAEKFMGDAPERGAHPKGKNEP